MAKQSTFFADMAKPFIVLVCICLAAAALLGYVHRVTEPVIEKITLERAEATRAAVLKGANGFTEVEVDTDALGITGAFVENSGLGYVMTAAYKGYGDDVTVTVGLDENGTIVGISADVSKETSGVGSKVGEEAYITRYVGTSGSASIDGISGATYTSTAVKNSVNAILAAFETVKEAAK